MSTSQTFIPSDESAIALVHELVRTPSVSREERGVSEALVRWGGAHGLSAKIDEVGNAVLQRSSGAVAEHERCDSARLIVLLGHMDTFPGMPEVRIENGFLFGRGSVDAKGPLAAFAVAAARAQLPAGVTLMVVGAVEEECPTSRGALAVAARLRPDACIIGEPSGTLGVTIGYKGRLLVDARVTRASAHSAGPDASASDDVLAWWAAALALVRDLNIGHSGAFDVIQATVRSLRSEQTGLSDTASLSASFRLPPWMTPEDFTHRLHALMPGVSVACTGGERAVLANRSNAVVRSLTQAVRASGLTPAVRVKTGTSDMNVVARLWDCPIAAYGPGDSALDHTPDEHVSLEEYLRSIRVLTDAIERLACELSTQPVRFGSQTHAVLETSS